MVETVVAVTGGVASGKSAVCERLAGHGASVIDADQVARELVAPGQPALAEIVARFGPEIVDEHANLRRRALRERIFADPGARRDLEAILHPRVRSVLRERAASAPGSYAVLAIPLLIESGHYDFVDRIIVVDVDPDTQRRRLMTRDGVDAALAGAMIAAQSSRAERLAIASDVLINDADLATLYARVDALHQMLQASATHCPPTAPRISLAD